MQIDALAIQGRASDLCAAPREALKCLATACEIGLSTRCRTPLPWILCERGRIHLALGEGMEAREFDQARVQARAQLEAFFTLR